MGKLERFEAKDAPNNFQYDVNADAEAWLAVLYSCMYADGIVRPSELDSLSRMLVLKEKFASVHFSDYYPRVKEAIERLGPHQILEQVGPQIEKEDQATLFVLAVEIVLADGIMTADEMEIIQVISTILDIDMDLVDQVIQVMLIRNKGNVVFGQNK